MKRKSLSTALVLSVFLFPGAPLPGETVQTSPPPIEEKLREEVESLTRQAAEYWLDNGRKEIIRELSTPEGRFDRGEIFVFACDMKGTLIAHRDMKKNPCRYMYSKADRKSSKLKKKMFTLARTEGAGWLTCYQYNPGKRKFSKKYLYILKKGNLIFCCTVPAR